MSKEPHGTSFLAFFTPFLLVIAAASFLILVSDLDQPLAKQEINRILCPDTLEDVVANPHQRFIVRKDFDPIYDDVARYISGMPVSDTSKLDKKFRNAPEWKSFASVSDRRWKHYDSTRVRVLKSWCEKELEDMNGSMSTLFYPFSGPDILNANIFFPDAETYVMVGLEPVGNVPFIGNDTIDTLSNYLGSVNNSLYAILKFSFFRTIAMKNDLKSGEVNGTIPLMLIFLARTGNEILDVKKVRINKEGKLDYQSGNVPGVEITFRKDTMHPEQKVYYFSTDLSNEGMLKTRKEFNTWIKSLGPVHTYLKSASYLLHNDFFSETRDRILEQSQHLLQDDSGIPYRFFPAVEWDRRLFGVYHGTISLFLKEFQEDYLLAFKTDSLNVRKLPFGIGYKWQQGESNLLLAKRK